MTFAAARKREMRLMTLRRHPAVAVLSVVVTGYALVSLLFAGLGLLLTRQFSAVTGWDADVSRWFAENRTDATNDWTSYATKVADTSGILVVLVAATIAFFIVRRPWNAVILLIALSIELVSFLSVNYLVSRPRPDVERLSSLPSTSSFPSGHTAAMVALYGGLAVFVGARFRSRAVAIVCCIAVALATAAIGFARVYRGMHYPTDVAAGALLGLAALGVAIVAARVGQIATADRRRWSTDRFMVDGHDSSGANFEPSDRALWGPPSLRR